MAIETVRDAFVLAAILALDGLEAAVRAFDDARYVQLPASGLSGTAGAHVRHCLSHFDVLLQGLEGGVIDYDTRVRETEDESSRAVALERLRETKRAFLALGGMGGNPVTGTDSFPVSVRQMTHAGCTGRTVVSTFERELAFVASHTTHHVAFLALLGESVGVNVPKGAGVAPSTEAWRKGSNPREALAVSRPQMSARATR